MENLSGYSSNVMFGLVSFPLIALAITLPYMIVQYRKFGSIPWLRTVIVYSFVFYLMVAYYMVVLPLPEDRTAFVAYAAQPQLTPFLFVQTILEAMARSSNNPSVWLSLIKNPTAYEALLNIVLLVPLGMYLRYYFRRTWWQTLLIGFGTTLFFELSQLTGLWGIYAHPYRLFDVDDLMLNTLGAMTGYWLAGPLMRRLPDIRIINEEARETGLRAGALRRALSFGLDTVVAAMASGGMTALLYSLGSGGAAEAAGLPWATAAYAAALASFLVFFVAIPSLTHGQTLGQKLLRLCIVRPDAQIAKWYHYLARYGLLYLFVTLPFVALDGIVSFGGTDASELGSTSGFFGRYRSELVWIWLVLMMTWAITLLVRAVHAARAKEPFVMLNGLISMTRVMSVEGAERERERRAALDVSQVAALERALAGGGIPLSDLMARAGAAVAVAVRQQVPDPAPIVVLAGAGNNGGDGWVVARLLAEAGYAVTLVAPDLAERLRTEPARTTAIDTFVATARQDLPLRVIVRPEIDQLDGAMEDAAAIVDAMLGTGFSGDEVREPFARWIECANQRRFEGARKPGHGRHRRRTRARKSHDLDKRRSMPERAKDAPFAISIDVPSGLSAQTGKAAQPCFAADLTVTMLAFKPGLIEPMAQRFTGTIRLAKLVDTKPYLEKLAAVNQGTDT